MQEQQPTEKSYYQQRMELLGITEEINTVKLLQYNTELRDNELQPVKIFREVPAGIDIVVYTIDRVKIQWAKEASEGKRNWKKDYCITRLEFPKTSKTGDTIKYLLPPKQPVVPFFPPWLLEKYDTGQEIPVLYMTEGYFKAFKAGMHGIDCVGLPSITCMKDKETGELHNDIKKLIIKCKVRRIVWLVDGDCRNITGKEITEVVDLYKRPNQFYRTVSTFVDLLSGFDTVNKYFAHINSADIEGEPKGLDDLLIALPDQVEDIAREFHTFDKIKESVYEGAYLVKMDVTYSAGKVRNYFKLHDVDAFYLHHLEKRHDLKGKSFKFNGTLYQYDDSEGKCKIIVPKEAGRYFRVGDKYYEYVFVPNKYKVLQKRIARREKTTIQDDNGKSIFNHIPKYYDFCMVPDHMNYQQVVDGCFNMYSPFVHEPEPGDCEATVDFIKHIFGTEPVTFENMNVPRYELGLDYITLLYKNPQHILPILCLVSNERQTGKTTFAQWLSLIFTENMAIVGNEDLEAPFNSHWATKLIICCDETKIDKLKVIEKVKNLSTSHTIMMQAKGIDQKQMEFFGKFMLLSNNEDNFVNIDEEEIRFWVIKVPRFKQQNVDLLDELKEEIPAFLHYLNTRQMATTKRERHWFATPLLKTEAWQRLVANSKPNIQKQFHIAMAELFEASELQTIHMRIDDVFTEVLRKRYDRNYVKETMEKLGYKLMPTQRRSFPRLQEVHVAANAVEGTPARIEFKVTMIHFVGRYYEFHRDAFLVNTAIIAGDGASDLPF